MQLLLLSRLCYRLCFPQAHLPSTFWFFKIWFALLFQYATLFPLALTKIFLKWLSFLSFLQGTKYTGWENGSFQRGSIGTWMIRQVGVWLQLLLTIVMDVVCVCVSFSLNVGHLITAELLLMKNIVFLNTVDTSDIVVKTVTSLFKCSPTIMKESQLLTVAPNH